MNCSSSTPCLLLYESDEPRTPLRSPSRLDFCLKCPENGGILPEGDDSMDFACTPGRPCTFNGDALAVEVGPLDCSQLLVVQGDEDDPPQTRDSHSCQNVDASMPRERSMNPVPIEPQSPMPVRPLSVQFGFDAQEVIPPSRTAPQRLNYPHHGFSRSALLQQKTLWNSRHGEWAEWQSRMGQGEAQRQESDAYTGLAATQPHSVENPPYMRTPPSGLERDLANSPSKRHEQGVRASIFPRVGDISALRDPYSVNIDRRFFKFPLWTLHKMLYMFDVHQRSASLTPPTSVCNSAHVPASTSSITLSSYASSTSGDEEPDHTLIADDRPSPASQLHLDPLKSASSLHCSSSWSRGWEPSWYSRWELLLGLFQRNQRKFDTLDMSMRSTEYDKARAAPSSPPEPTLYLNAGDDGGGNDIDEAYGTDVLNPFLSVDVDFNEECERALAFFRRESKHPEMAS